MKTRIVSVGVALAVSVVGVGALSVSTTCAVDVLGDEVAEFVVERCGSSPAAPSPNDEVVSDLRTAVARKLFAPVTPILRAP